MGDVLGRKQRIKNSDWIDALAKIEQTVTRKNLDRLVDKTVKEIKKKTRGKKAAYAWSGGKDSLVLEKVSQMAGIQSCVLVICNWIFADIRINRHFLLQDNMAAIKRARSSRECTWRGYRSR